jgi:hypothetical protein
LILNLYGDFYPWMKRCNLSIILSLLHFLHSSKIEAGMQLMQ